MFWHEKSSTFSMPAPFCLTFFAYFCNIELIESKNLLT